MYVYVCIYLYHIYILYIYNIYIYKYVYIYIYIYIINNGTRNNYGIRLKVSCFQNHQVYIRQLIWKNKNIIQFNDSFQNHTSSHHKAIKHFGCKNPDYKTPWNSCCKMLYKPKSKQNAVLKWSICQYAAECIAIYWHIKWKIINIKGRYQSIISLPSILGNIL